MAEECYWNENVDRHHCLVDLISTFIVSSRRGGVCRWLELIKSIWSCELIKLSKGNNRRPVWKYNKSRGSGALGWCKNKSIEIRDWASSTRWRLAESNTFILEFEQFWHTKIILSINDAHNNISLFEGHSPRRMAWQGVGLCRALMSFGPRHVLQYIGNRNVICIYPYDRYAK